MLRHHRTIVVALLPLLLELTTSCADRTPTELIGQTQATAFQEALRACLGRSGIEYRPVVEAPGSVTPVVPAPAPYEWWASHGGYGLIDDQAGEAVIEVNWVDPNQHAFDQTAGLWRRSLYGTGGSPASFRRGSCYDTALRHAGFFDESRFATLPEPTPEQRSRAAADPEVAAARRRRGRCLITSGVDARFTNDPEGVLRRQFTADGLIAGDGVRGQTADAERTRSARRLEERVAVADVRCRRRVGLDRAVDAALRRQLSGGS